MLSAAPLALAALLLGSKIFFAYLIAPSARNLLDAESAAHYLDDALPRFYLWGMAVSALGALLAAYQRNAAALLLLAVFTAYFYARQFLTPRLRAARETWQAGGSAQDKAQFDKLHKRGVLLGAIQAVLLAVFIAAA